MRRSALIVVALLLLLPAALWSQQAAESPGSISGTVIDQATGLPLSNVTVFVISPYDFKTFRKTTTEHDGSFELHGLSLGKFVVDASLFRQAGATNLDKIKTRVVLTRESPAHIVTIRLDTSAKP
jgi:Carboxypeptidase regulatory-like domain